MPISYNLLVNNQRVRGHTHDTISDKYYIRSIKKKMQNKHLFAVVVVYFNRDNNNIVSVRKTRFECLFSAIDPLETRGARCVVFSASELRPVRLREDN